MRKITIISLFLFSLSLSINAQIRIVGENAEKPSSKINYYDQPVRLEETFYPFDCTRTKVRELFLPNHQKFLVLNGERDGRFFRFQNDTIYRGIPKGYYTVDSVYVTKEECVWLYSFLGKDKLVKWVEQEYESRFDNIIRKLLVSTIKHMYSYLGLQEAILTTEKKNLYTVRPPIYILNNEQGITYYLIHCAEIPHVVNEDEDLEDYAARYRRDGRGSFFSWGMRSGPADCISVDGYNNLINEFKGEKCGLIFPEKTIVKDYYTGRVIPYKIIAEPGSSHVPGTLSWNFYRSTAEFPYLCRDILIDNTGELAILFVLEDEEGNRFTIPGGRNPLVKGYDRVFFTEDESSFNSDIIISERIISRKSMDRFRIAQSRQKEAEQQIEAKRRQKNITTYGNHFGGLINDHKLAIGMTPEMCVASIGHPGRLYRSTTSSRTEMTYFYAYMAVRFVDGKLVRIDELL